MSVQQELETSTTVVSPEALARSDHERRQALRLKAVVVGVVVGLISLVLVGRLGLMLGLKTALVAESTDPIISYVILSAPILAIFGGLFCTSRSGIGGLLLLISAGEHAYLLGFGATGCAFILPLIAAGAIGLAAEEPTDIGIGKWIGRNFGLLAIVGALLLPLQLRNFTIFQLTQVMVYAIAIMGLNLLTGINGQFSLGHSAFYAIGAYTAAILMDQAGMSYVLTLPIAAILCFIVGFLFGFPALKLEGIYLALATFGLAVAAPQILKLTPFEHWTGGVQGIVISKPDAPFGLKLTQDQWLYYFTLVVGLLLYILAVNIIRSRTGRAMMAIRDNAVAARTMGVNLSLYKTLAFGVSAAFTGVAGALGAIVVQFVAPDSFTFALSVLLFVGLVVGGVGWIPGALFGGAFVLFAPNVAEGSIKQLSDWSMSLIGHPLIPNAESLSKGMSGAVYGLFLIVLIYVMPSGAAGLLRTTVKALSPRR